MERKVGSLGALEGNLCYKVCFIVSSLGVVFAVLGVERIRWCTVSKEELSKCNDMSKAFGGAGILPPLECAEGGSAANCTQMIKVSCDSSVIDLITP